MAKTWSVALISEAWMFYKYLCMMFTDSPGPFLSRVAALWLMFRVHLDALLINPSRYLTSVKWLILGKKVRARGQLAPLLSTSPRAYQLWTMREAAALPHSPVPADLPIVALVRAGSDPIALNSTLQNLIAAGIKSWLIVESNERQLSDFARHNDFSRGEWFMPIFAGDHIAPCAGQLYLSAMAQADPSCSVIYADDDRIDRWGHRNEPYFKPDWNPELQSHCDILTGACIIKADATAFERVAQHSNWAEALIAEATKRGSIKHICALLHHRLSNPAASAWVEPLRTANNLPPLSVIIPIRNRADLLRTCIAGLRTTHYPDIEIIIANNDSDDPETLAYLEALAREGVMILDQPGPFNFSTINNNAVAAARGELLCLMNNDVEILSPDWLAVMATQALRPEVGAVGAQLLYPDGRIQHAGVVIGVGNAAGHAHRFLRPEAQGYFRRHALPQFVSAVTAACLVVQKDRFLAVGGLDETNFAVAFNDVDLCLKLNERGWQSFYEPRAVLVHHESISRGHDTDPVGAARFAGELAALQRIWRTNEVVDPYHHPSLSRASEQFVLDLTAMASPAL
jgi:GT2 family glycosyltransferase